MAFPELIDLLLHPSKEDIVTSCFDLIFVYSGIQNVRQLIKDKEVKGFDWKNMCLYLLWNLWSIFIIYPQASLYLANLINLIYLVTQVTWLILFAKYQWEKYQDNINVQF